MKKASTLLLALVVLTGCGTPDYHFSQFVGAQQNWTTSPGSFVKVVDGVQIYTQYPPRPYELIGAVIVHSERQLARAAKYYHADAALLYRRSSSLNGEMVLAGPPLWMAYPLTEDRITAQLIRFK